MKSRCVAMATLRTQRSIQSEAACKIQRAWRKHKCRQVLKRLRKRWHVALEFANLERLYVSNIAYVCVLYEQPLRQKVYVLCAKNLHIYIYCQWIDFSSLTCTAPFISFFSHVSNTSHVSNNTNDTDKELGTDHDKVS